MGRLETTIGLFSIAHPVLEG